MTCAFSWPRVAARGAARAGRRAVGGLSAGLNGAYDPHSVHFRVHWENEVRAVDARPKTNGIEALVLVLTA